jgi:hypothetical protein
MAQFRTPARTVNLNSRSVPPFLQASDSMMARPKQAPCRAKCPPSPPDIKTDRGHKKRLLIEKRADEVKHNVITAALGFILIGADAEAQNTRNCAPRDLIVDRLASGYGETRQSIGLGKNSPVIEVFASDETGTWTITVTSPNRQTCLVASGEAFETMAEAPPAKGKKA